MKSPMKVYTIRDHAGCESTHLAVSSEAAIQAHLFHYGLLYLEGEITIVSVKELIDVERSSICWEPTCCLIGATNV
jgi:hypothetical protein